MGGWGVIMCYLMTRALSKDVARGAVRDGAMVMVAATGMAVAMARINRH